ncbi:P-loop containing nucleoside triphosphate hydrolase protein [Cladochytrium replicatum]|nr:P-loop containing nucleoside triphosphate hydrolase protein [Cladochytrium replicatum]
MPPKKSSKPAAPAPVDDEPQSKSAIKKALKEKSIAEKEKSASGPNASAKEDTKAEHNQLFGNWTGKTPVSLLHEHCQRMSWHKPNYQHVRAPPGMHKYVVVLSRPNPKSPSETMRVTFGADGVTGWPSDLHAKHYAAVYALHRVCSHLKLHNLLPHVFRTYWMELEAKKTAGGDSVEFDYVPDPFLMDPKTMKEKRRLQEIEQKRAEEEVSPQLEFPHVHMSPENRQVVEDLIKTLKRPMNAVVQSEARSENKDKIEKDLIKMGFRRAHILEALQYCGTQTECLHWLGIHVPEDDLPEHFVPTLAAARYMVTSQHDTASLANEYAIKRLISCGFPRSAVNKIFYDCQCNEVDALAHLFQQLVRDASSSEDDSLTADADEIAQVREEELEALVAIYDTNVIISDDKRKVVVEMPSLTGVVSGSTSLDIQFPEHSKYPYELPALVVRNDSLPSYIRLSLMKAAGMEALNLLGTPMIFAVTSWLEDNMRGIVENPPPLMSLNASMTAHEDAAPVQTSSSQSGKKGQGGGKYVPDRQLRSFEGVANTPESIRVLDEFNRKKQTKEYQYMLEGRKKLPSYNFREEIISALESNQVLIVCGETGCGKSTQTGQFILDHLIETGRGEQANIICTQPRRISAMALAERVAAERCEKVGASIGYAIRGETVRSKNTRLMFCTTGILLRMIQTDTLLSDVSCVIIDEVHERGVDSDFLLIILRRLEQRKDLKVILMSATINSETFSIYFRGAPVLEIPGFTHPVKDIYLESIIKETGYIMPFRMKGGRKKALEEEEKDESAKSYVSQLASDMGLDDAQVDSIRAAEITAGQIDYDLIAATAKHICEVATDLEDDRLGAILIFLPGVMEIKRCVDQLSRDLTSRYGRFEIFPLHANLTPKEQSRVFRRMPKGVRKIVVSTNVAETSITIDDVVYVIDSGRVKQMQFDGYMLNLTEVWASRASCKQRRGRAGRVKPGVCYRLYTKRIEASKMPAHEKPEMLRMPLEQLCLQIKAMGVSDVTRFLREAIDPPSLANIERAVSTLRELNALDRDTGELTALGRHMATIPADLRIAKMLIYGSIFNCLDPILTIAAILSNKSPFVSPLDKRDEAAAARKAFSTGYSDLLTDARAFEEWNQLGSDGKLSRAALYAEEREFCEKNFLSSVTLTSIADLRDQYRQILVDIGFVTKSESEGSPGKVRAQFSSSQIKVLKAVLVAGLYPNVVRIAHPAAKFEQTAHGTVEKEATDARQVKLFARKPVGRVFVHPSSVNFGVPRFPKDGGEGASGGASAGGGGVGGEVAEFGMYHQVVVTSKTFVRDLTTVSAYPLLLFGGSFQVDMENMLLLMDDFCKFQTFPRIAILMNGLRRLLDEVLESKIADPSLDVLESSPVVRVIMTLILNDGT